MSLAGNLKLYDAIKRHNFSEDLCFLCGVDISGDVSSREHVFPKWLLTKFNLWDLRVVLLNGTEIPYRNLTIPCCKKCNNEHLSKIEADVRENFLLGSESMQKMDRKVLMLWVLKIFYGLLYRELFLVFDRKESTSASIVSSDDMEQFQLLHYILQASRVPINFTQSDSDIPASIFVFDLDEPEEVTYRFDYKDDVLNRTLYLRMGNVGILASFDMGAQTAVGSDFFAKYQNISLHPIQFQELGANLFMKARKFNRVPKVMISENDAEINFYVLPLAGLSTAPVFYGWEPEEMAEMLMVFQKYPREVVMPIPGRIVTWLHNDDGTIRRI